MRTFTRPDNVVARQQIIADALIACGSSYTGSGTGPRDRVIALTQQYQSYFFNLVWNSKVSKPLPGSEIKSIFRVGTGGNNQGYIDRNEPDSVIFNNKLTVGGIGKVRFRNGCGWDTIDIANNTAGLSNSALSAKIVDLMALEIEAMNEQIADQLEAGIWGAPDNEADGINPLGFRYWFTRSATAGWNGVDHPDFPSGRAGIKSSLYPRWANYTGSWTNFTHDDIGLALRRAFAAIQWKTFDQAPAKDDGVPITGLYQPMCNHETKIAIEKQLWYNNENHGKKMWELGPTILNCKPFLPIPALASDTDNPIYLVPLGGKGFCNYYTPGYKMQLTTPKPDPSNHVKIVMFSDTEHNYGVEELHSCGVLIQSGT